MRATVRDSEVIGSLTPINVAGYLRSRGWQKFNELRGRFSVWRHKQFPDAEVVLPATKNLRDYASQLFDVLRELESVEGRSQLGIIRDLHNSGFDVIRLAAQAPGTIDGTVKIDAGVQLFERTREMILAAACAAVRPRPVFHSRKPPQALEYMSKARLGQTEKGSYVLTVLSPTSPQLAVHSDTELFPEEPFERAVVRTLASSMELAALAAEITGTATAPDFSAFRDTVEGGVSANLCEAISGFFSTIEATAIDLSVSWSLNRPPPNDQTPSKVRISDDLVPTLQEAARVFRARDKLEGYSIEGPVVKLERLEGHSSGYVTVLAPVEDAIRKVTFELSEPEYGLATRAHASYQPIRVTGTVAREGRTYKLLDPTGLRMIEDEDSV
jgi:hypothetical protein